MSSDKRKQGNPAEPKPKPADAADKSYKLGNLSALESAVNSASSGTTGLWLSFLTFMAYLTMTVGSVSHEILLLAKPIKLPVLNVDLPLVAFFWIAPIFFVLFHFYLLLQIAILIRKVGAYDDFLEQTIDDDAIERERRRKRLDSFIIVQFLFGSRGERSGTTSMLLRGVAFITLVLAPILVLLQFQVTFLPYHNSWVTWAHRATILIDLRLAWVFWSAICHSRGEISFPELNFGWRALFRASTIVSAWKHAAKQLAAAMETTLSTRWVGFVCSIAVIVLSLFGIAYKGEPIERLAQVPYFGDGGIQFTTISDVLLHGSIDMVQGRPRRYFSNVLVVPNKKLVNDDAVDNAFPSFSLRGRDLRGAILIGTDLRGVDFTGANLSDARLDQARLTLARFTCVLTPSQSITADKPKLKVGWPDDECTWLQRATFTQAQLEGANFSRARMHGAILLDANLQAARLNGTQLQEAILTGAQMQGAQLEGTNLTNAFLDNANLLGAKISTPQLKGALLSGTRLDLAELVVGWNSALVEPILFYPRQNLPDPIKAGLDRSDQEIISTFGFTAISAGNLSSFVEDTIVNFDDSGMDKAREAAVAMLAGQNKADGDLNFEKKRKNAVPKRWKEIKDTVEQANSAKPELARALELREYLIRFACDTGSSPFITGALFENLRVFDIEKRVIDLLVQDHSKEPTINPEKEARKLITKLKSPGECPGVLKLKKEYRIMLESYEDMLASELKRADFRQTDASPGLHKQHADAVMNPDASMAQAGEIK